MEGKTQPEVKRVLVAGASGYIGEAVVRELRSRGYAVTALTRSPQAGASLSVDLGDAAATQEALTQLQPQTVISCMASRSGAPADAWAVDHDANATLLTAAEAAGVTHFQLVSAICVQKPRLAFQHAKLAFEARLRASSLSHSIVRPTAFFKSLSGQIERVLAGKEFLLFGDGTQTACKPIGREDLARYLVTVLERPALHDQTLAVGGPGGALTPRQQGELLFELTGQTPRFRSVSLRLFGLVEACLKPLAPLSARCAAKAEFARIGRYYATESMLRWDEAAGRYDPAGTPSFGTQTLTDHYRELLIHGTYTDRDEAQRLF